MRAKLSDELVYVPDGQTKLLVEPFPVQSDPVVHSDTIAEFLLHSSNVVEQRQQWGSAMTAHDFKQAAPYEGINRVLVDMGLSGKKGSALPLNVQDLESARHGRV
jgi:hypothetical protein